MKYTDLNYLVGSLESAVRSAQQNLDSMQERALRYKIEKFESGVDHMDFVLHIHTGRRRNGLPEVMEIPICGLQSSHRYCIGELSIDFQADYHVSKQQSPSNVKTQVAVPGSGIKHILHWIRQWYRRGKRKQGHIGIKTSADDSLNSEIRIDGRPLEDLPVNNVRKL